MSTFDTTVRQADGTGKGTPTLLAFWPGHHTRVPLAGIAVVRIGRGAENDVRIELPSVSRRHALLHVNPPSIEDLGSANGTRMGTTRLPARQRVALQPGTVIELGDAVLCFQTDPHTPLGAFAPSSATSRVSMAELERTALLAARSDLTLLIRGETGVGKEVLAARIHEASVRALRPFLRVNCAALSESLFESELFGHERGAFTGAGAAREGYFEAANGGTLLLDEIGDLSRTMQVKLLRVLEAREIVRVGAVKARPVDVRILAATHRDLEEMVSDGEFRSDLYYRLDGLTLHIPPLRERPAEIEPLARTLAEAASGMPARLEPDAIARLVDYRWPGNVRELRNVIERALVLAGNRPIAAAHLRIAGETAPARRSLRDELESVERRRIEDALASTGGNQSEAARLLGMPRRTLTKRLSEYELPRPRKPR